MSKLRIMVSLDGNTYVGAQAEAVLRNHLAIARPLVLHGDLWKKLPKLDRLKWLYNHVKGRKYLLIVREPVRCRRDRSLYLKSLKANGFALRRKKR